MQKKIIEHQKFYFSWKSQCIQACSIALYLVKFPPCGPFDKLIVAPLTSGSTISLCYVPPSLFHLIASFFLSMCENWTHHKQNQILLPSSKIRFLIYKCMQAPWKHFGMHGIRPGGSKVILVRPFHINNMT